MVEETLTIVVDRDIEDLIPNFMRNRQREVEALLSAYAQSDLDQLQQISHRMRGVGESYGFTTISLLGKDIEEAAKRGNLHAIEPLLQRYAEFLSTVRVVYH